MSFNTGEVYKLSSSTSAESCHQFSIAEIHSATNDFDDDLIIGDGGFGKVYKGNICIKGTSQVVAIKRLDSMSNQGAPEFRTEIEMLSKLRHCNLVSLIGFCDDNMEMILVYEYMPHGTLHAHLHKTTTPLSWVQRLKIAIGAATSISPGGQIFTSALNRYLEKQCHANLSARKAKDLTSHSSDNATSSSFLSLSRTLTSQKDLLCSMIKNNKH